MSEFSSTPHPTRTGLTTSRRLSGVLVALLGVPALTVLMLPLRATFGLDTVLLLYLLVTTGATALGGLWPAVVATLGSALCANYFFTTPYHSLRVHSRTEIIDLFAFVAVAMIVAAVTELAARARTTMQRTQLETEWARELSAAEHGPESLPTLLTEARRVFGMDAVTLAEDDTIVARVGTLHPESRTMRADAGEGLTLTLHGPAIVGHDRRLLGMLATTVGRLYRTQQLAAQAERADELSRIDAVRTALLAAVSHDLRTPLAGIKASVATLREPALQLTDAERTELLDEVDTETDRLTDLVANLLEMSRIQAGALVVSLRPTVVADVLDAINPSIRVTIADDLPLVQSDPGLLERVIANLVENAHRHAGGPVELRAGRYGDHVRIEVVDHGPGVGADRLEQIFVPFQRLDDHSSTGTGLGLAIARGFVEAMGGTITASQTPGGGLTMTIELERA